MMPLQLQFGAVAPTIALPMLAEQAAMPAETPTRFAMQLAKAVQSHGEASPQIPLPPLEPEVAAVQAQPAAEPVPVTAAPIMPDRAVVNLSISERVIGNAPIAATSQMVPRPQAKPVHTSSEPPQAEETDERPVSLQLESPAPTPGPYAPAPATPPPSTSDKLEVGTATIPVVEATPTRTIIMTPKGQADAPAEIELASAKTPIKLDAAPVEFSLPTASSPLLFADKVTEFRVEAKPPIVDTSAQDWVADLAHEIVSARRADNEISFRLAPRHLGTLDIELRETADGLTVEMRTSTEEATQMIQRDTGRLIDDLRQRGINITDTSLHFGASGDGRNSRNGAIPLPGLPLPERGQEAAQDQDQHRRRPLGRFA